jgi:small subunit ribosomal protein S29
MIGKATTFPLKDNDPFRIFGLPKKMLLEVCAKPHMSSCFPHYLQFQILSKPCSTIQDVTVTAVKMLEWAKMKFSLDMRVVLSWSPRAHLIDGMT